MQRFVQGNDRAQTSLLPASLEDYVDADNLARSALRLFRHQPGARAIIRRGHCIKLFMDVDLHNVICCTCTHRGCAEAGRLLRVMLAFKRLPQLDQPALLSDPWEFGAWVDQQSGGDRRAFRHMLLYLCFPESYERISSWRHKRKIRESLSDRLPSNERDSDNWSRLATDRVLFSLRRVFENEYKTTELDFYLPPLRPLWSQT